MVINVVDRVYNGECTSVVLLKRWILRRFEHRDLKNLYLYRNNEACSRYQRWDATSEESLKDLIEKHQNRELEDGDIYLAIADSYTDELIGEVYIALKEKTITLGYTISPEYQRKGYAYEVLSTLIPELLNEYTGFEIVCLVHSNNQPSKKLLEKLGFKKQGCKARIYSKIFSLYIF